PEEEWKRIYKKTPYGQIYETKLECAEVVFVPNSVCRSKNLIDKLIADSVQLFDTLVPINENSFATQKVNKNKIDLAA
ncbi:MAG: hypothetical protein LBI41_02435, partial [Lactobacillales bacterium]|nr:hypothetical protein [Lactobacillales bacterium]